VKFTTLAANEDVATLARRLYRPASPEAQRDAERTLLRANPRLADASARLAGTVVVVPDVSGATPTSEARGEGELIVPILQGARDRLSQVAEAMKATIDGRRAIVKATLDQIGSTALRQLVNEEPTLRDVVAGVSNEARTESAEIDALEALQQQALGELGQDLDDLIRSVGGQPGPPPPSPEQPRPTPGPVEPRPPQPGPIQPGPVQPGPVPRPTPSSPAPPSPITPSPVQPRPPSAVTPRTSRPRRARRPRGDDS
jgi:hypothetical protein